jgi:hypothetical protein
MQREKVTTCFQLNVQHFKLKSGQSEVRKGPLPESMLSHLQLYDYIQSLYAKTLGKD